MHFKLRMRCLTVARRMGGAVISVKPLNDETPPNPPPPQGRRRRCCCGEAALGSVHRSDGPCYSIPDPTIEPPKFKRVSEGFYPPFQDSEPVTAICAARPLPPVLIYLGLAALFAAAAIP